MGLVETCAQKGTSSILLTVFLCVFLCCFSLAHCGLSESSCAALASAASSTPSLRELDLSLNVVNASVLENCK